MLGTRYRVVRAEEYAAVDGHGGIETPRPTDPEPLTPDWSPGAGAHSPRVDNGLVLDPDAPLSPLQAAERIALRPVAYSGTGFPGPVLSDSARAVESHPDVLLMPAAFLIVERLVAIGRAVVRRAIEEKIPFGWVTADAGPRHGHHPP